MRDIAAAQGFHCKTPLNFVYCEDDAIMKKTALITGATSGLGLSYAKFFASQGYDLIITGRREQIIRENALRMRAQFQIEVEVIIVELSAVEGVDHLISKIQNRKIDVLVNNAGFGLKPAFVDTPEEDIDKMLYLQIWCVTKLTQFVLREMVQRDAGVIINISSDGAFAVMPRNVLYSSTKLYLLNFTEGLHMELAETNISVQAVCPGFIDSHFHESAGMRRDQSRKGFMEFRKPDDIVADAMKDLAKGKVVSVPGASAKVIRILVRLLPRKTFYKVSSRISKTIQSKK